MTDLSLLRPCCLLNLLLRDEITRAAAPNAPKYVRHVVWGSSFLFSFPFTAVAMTMREMTVDRSASSMRNTLGL